MSLIWDGLVAKIRDILHNAIKSEDVSNILPRQVALAITAGRSPFHFLPSAALVSSTERRNLWRDVDSGFCTHSPQTAKHVR